MSEVVKVSQRRLTVTEPLSEERLAEIEQLSQRVGCGHRSVYTRNDALNRMLAEVRRLAAQREAALAVPTAERFGGPAQTPEQSGYDAGWDDCRAAVRAALGRGPAVSENRGGR